MQIMLENPKVRFRIDFGPKCSVGIGKVELLERIAGSGSLSQAARDLHMSYRRAWLLLKDMNSGFDQPVVVTSTGGRGGGGAALTSFGRQLVAKYRKMEQALGPLAEAHFAGLVTPETAKVAPRARKWPVPVVSIRRKVKTP